MDDLDQHLRGMSALVPRDVEVRHGTHTPRSECDDKDSALRGCGDDSCRVGGAFAKLEDDDVETVGGLMAKQLNKVPIAGSVVKYDALELVAERSAGRRNKIGTVIVTKISSADSEADARAEAATRIVSEQARAS